MCEKQREIDSLKAEIERLRTIVRLQDNEIAMLRARLRADTPFDAVEDYKQFRRDNPDTVTVEE